MVSNVVYQGRAGGLDPEELWRLSLFATDGLQPDLNVVLDLPVELAATRRKAAADRIEAQGAAIRRRCGKDSWRKHDRGRTKYVL